ncbi:YtcA family lipoprotein [Rhodoblastus sp.]|uniref:YtcA family lipoprotein n=1 Tax=Rhodoblastus sp. TaxID=1962975 RepID=UPI0035B2C4B7
MARDFWRAGWRDVTRLSPKPILATTGAALALAGCAREGAPSFIIAGAYFPAWMACALAGILVALVLRILLGRLGMARSVAYGLTFYSATAVVSGAAFWLFGFGY